MKIKILINEKITTLKLQIPKRVIDMEVDKNPPSKSIQNKIERTLKWVAVLVIIFCVFMIFGKAIKMQIHNLATIRFTQ